MPSAADPPLSFHGQKIFITGAGGFIGSHLCEALVVAGAKVRALLRYSSQASLGSLAFLPPEILSEIEIVFGNIEDVEALAQGVENCALVFHLAALIGIPYSYHAPRSYLQTNITGTLNLLEAARQAGTPRVVFCSTSEVYGSARALPIAENHPLQGQSPYSASKIAAEKLVESFHCSFALPVVIVRPFNTFGPRQSARALIPSIILQGLHQPEIELGTLTTKRDYTYVTDTCTGLMRAGAIAGIEGLVCNLGVGQGISVEDLARMILTNLKMEKPIRSVPERVRPATSEIEQLQSDNRLAQTRLGWTPQVSLRDGLARTIDFFRAQPPPSARSRYVI